MRHACDAALGGNCIAEMIWHTNLFGENIVADGMRKPSSGYTR
ncbi:hypothetical protein BSLA_02f0059 [Burkholderia stabilis]|nr:hypothetical protein BSLA_02f0059 [Burkholderia stabilis]